MINKQKMGKSGRGSSKELNRGGSGRDGNGVQTYDGRSNMGKGEDAGQPKNPGPGAGQVATEKQLEEREDAIDLSEQYEEAWFQYLAEFDQKIWPIFKRHGYTKDAALLMWRMQAIYDAVDEMAHPPHSDPF